MEWGLGRPKNLSCVSLVSFSGGSNNTRTEKFMLMSIVGLARGSVHARPSTRPPLGMSGIVVAHVSAPQNTSPNP